MSPFHEHTRCLFWLVLLACVSLLVGCGEEKASQPEKRGVVSRKIVVPEKKGRISPLDKLKKATTDETAPSASVASLVPPYDPTGRIDPFLPPRQSVPDATPGKKIVRKKRKPQTPLEKVDLNQLRLVGIIGTPTGKTAMVEDGKGKGYVVQIGTFIGINTGKVSSIGKDRIIVTEIVADFTGELKEVQRQLKLDKPTGE